MSNRLSFLAEVIECSLSRFKGQCWQKDGVPPFGSLMVVDDGNRLVFGLVQQIYTISDDAVRHINAYQKTEEELLRDQPQIFTFIKTFFHVLVLGYQQDGQIFQKLSPLPVRLHSFIRPACIEEYKSFFKEHYYVNLLFNQANQIDNIDELLLTLVNNFKEKGLSEEFVEALIEQYALLNSADYRRLKFFIERIENSL
ncbi:TPA: hypothetical protein DIC20_03265 [Candidatus Dependentiae bacterium]|nr:MAG: hypothetical protein US03_C0001G0043 [candidate division TM6 bacterium GW2011_GWF2_36_131]KKQ03821.1 MAG: hypothetical protein US13_C0001G0161 [candidate division TM6 bacterium GW2011_GWE2_36_25]KKQ19967.1 MAG: hypothetical protein US32_C0003G0084 [candidate division TM6 bacterium GW2011_GWA2_36_9]HBR70589.1 hypothetical protein [Candidatus Dependentiae bacterium]HCU00695.1 hypothetical protein [Candidatus Dependentiae bacterium]